MIAVIGLGFGDEGKGLVTDYLCSTEQNVKAVARFSGGQQAGHTVYKDDCSNESHVFSNFGSGSFRNIPTYWMKYCTIDPDGILNEFNMLKYKGINPKLFIHPKCPVTTPYDKFYNQNDDQMKNNGTCGVGVGATWQREKNRYSLLYEDLFSKQILKIKLNQIKDYYKSGNGININNFINNCLIVYNLFDVESYIDARKVIFEGSQGLLLDQDIGFFPHVTRSNTGSKNLKNFIDKYYAVTRAYQTRHGNGPMTNTDIPFEIKYNPMETNKKHLYQGEFKISVLDLDLLIYGIKKDGLKLDNLVITCLDQMIEYKLTFLNDLYTFPCEKNFISFIKSKLLPKNIYLSYGPSSSTIVKYKIK